jgi:hypothetical protein
MKIGADTTAIVTYLLQIVHEQDFENSYFVIMSFNRLNPFRTLLPMFYRRMDTS